MAHRVLWWTKAWLEAERRVAPGAGIAVVLLSLAPAALSAQRGQVQVSYDVEFFHSGAQPVPVGQCSGTGFDKLSGTIVGAEPAPAHEDNTYEGKLTRRTQMTLCYVGPDPAKPDQHINC